MTDPGDVVIAAGVRTPFCKAGTLLAPLAADELGRQAANALLTKTGVDPGLIDEVIFGCVSQPPEASNIARVIGLRSGIPESVPALTVSRNCASGFEAIIEAALRIQAGRGDLYLVGGTESMSRIPLYFSQKAAAKFAAFARARNPLQQIKAGSEFRFSDFQPQVGLQMGLTDPVSGLNMGETAEKLARELGISREAQDAFALRSHKKAVAGKERLAEEIAPVFVMADGKMRTVTEDNGPRENVSLERLAALKPVFGRRNGDLASVTAGNSSQISDGAVALLVASYRKARELGLEPLGKLVEFATVGCDPARMGLGPVPAIQALEKRGLELDRVDVAEINEAFAAQVLAVLRELGKLDEERLNVNGGAIALGHPVGATGSRLALTALMELRRRNVDSADTAHTALVALCVGGGQGSALWLERI